jgi:hypothetical protein
VLLCGSSVFDVLSATEFDSISDEPSLGRHVEALSKRLGTLWLDKCIGAFSDFVTGAAITPDGMPGRISFPIFPFRAANNEILRRIRCVARDRLEATTFAKFFGLFKKLPDSLRPGVLFVCDDQTESIIFFRDIGEIGTLSKAGLAQRRIVQGMDQRQAAAYVADKYDLTVDDVREMRKAVGRWRGVYEARYREIRHKIFAHKSLGRTDADKLMAKTNIDEVKELLGFLHSLYAWLSQLHIKGIAPDISPATFDLPPVPRGSKADERMYRESADLLYGMLDP